MVRQIALWKTSAGTILPMGLTLRAGLSNRDGGRLAVEL